MYIGNRFQGAPYTGSQNDPNKSDQKHLCLLDFIGQCNFFEKMPKNFTISTNNRSCKFNSEILRCASRTISQHLLNKSNNYQYHIKTTDESNILGKFEQLYQGIPVTFKKKELISNNQISQLFEINPQVSFGKSFLEYSVVGIESNFLSLVNAFKDNTSFTIKTNNSQYKCNYIGVFSSKVITEFIQANPNSTSYTYDFNDEYKEFQLICDFFNFKKVPLSTNNAITIKKIAEELNIMFVSSQINDFLNDYYNFSQIIDDEQDLIDEINDLFELLYNIESKTVKTVKNTLILSKWCKTEDKVLELASCVIQVINSGMILHRYLAELIFELDNDSNDDNNLKIFLPFIAKNLMDSFGSSLTNCSFVYILYKKGIISKDEIINKLKNSIWLIRRCIDRNYYIDNRNNNNNSINILNVKTQVLLWFLPEIIEIKNIQSEDLLQGHGPHVHKFIQYYFDKIDLYKQLRDKGEPDDELTFAIRHDDVDKLQSILLNEHSNVDRIVIPFNIYEEFIPDCKCKLINYCAAYGSIKCFKYLFLNHHILDENSFKLAVYGGNTEIIKIIDQNNIQKIQQDKHDFMFDDMHNTRIDDKFDIFNNTEPITISIIKHQYDLFDWILEKKLAKSDFNNTSFFDLINIASKNGNAHSLTELLIKCFEFTKKFFDKKNLNDKSIYEKIIETLCKNGFYIAVKLLINIFQSTYEKIKQNSLELIFENITTTNYKESSDPFSLLKEKLKFSFGLYNNPSACFKAYKVSHGSLSIFKLFVNSSNQDELEYLLSFSIVNNYVHIVKYYFENLVKKNIFKIRKEGIGNILLYSLCDKTNYFFDYIMNQIKLSNPNVLEDFKWSIPMLTRACYTQNFKVVKFITDNILRESPNEDFINPFCAAASSNSIEICKFFIDKKVFISFTDISNIPLSVSSTNEEIFLIIKQNTSQEEFKGICKLLFDSAVKNGNKPLVEFILKEKIIIKEGLIISLKNNDLEMAKTIIKYGDSKLINKMSNNETALTVAVENNHETIVELLLNYEYFDKEDSLFNYALYISKDKIRNILLNSKYLDINDTMYTRRNQPKEKDNNDNQPNINISDTLLIYSVRNRNQQMIDLIINHPTFNKKKSRLNKAVFIAIVCNDFQIFKKLIHLIDTDIYNYTYREKTIFSFINISTNKPIFNLNSNNRNNNKNDNDNQQKYISEIINEPAIILDKNSLNDAFRVIFQNSIKNGFNSKNLIELIEYDKKRNNCININESLSSLYSTLPGIKQKAFSFLLEIGFDPNIPDSHGVYLLQYALFLDAYSFIHSNIQSNKIDIKLKVPIIPYESYRVNHNSTFGDNQIKFEWERISSSKIVVKNYTTYLHLAAKCSNSQILKEFLDKKLIDVNVEDDFGNTPLIEACISKRKDNILQLFKLDDIDYQHCNKEGYDALKIINPALKDDDKVIQDKQQYLKELMNYCIPNKDENTVKNKNVSLF